MLGQENPVVHGDLKADNVLINSRGQPCLCDFGLSRILVDNTLWNTTAKEAGGTLRWKAPELLDPKLSEPTATPKSDIYSFAMTCYEILTNHVPLYQYKNDAQVIFNVVTGEARLERPENVTLTDSIWTILSRCWTKAEERPTANDVHRELLDLEHRCHGELDDRCLIRCSDDGSTDSNESNDSD